MGLLAHQPPEIDSVFHVAVFSKVLVILIGFFKHWLLLSKVCQGCTWLVLLMIGPSGYLCAHGPGVGVPGDCNDTNARKPLNTENVSVNQENLAAGMKVGGGKTI